MNDENIKKTIALKIKSYRSQKGLTQEMLASIIGSEQKNFSRIENAKVLPETLTICKLIAKGGISPEYLLGFLSEKTIKEYNTIDFEIIDLLIKLSDETKLHIKELILSILNKH